MLLSLVVHTHSLRYWLPAAVMMGTAPVYLLTWAAWRLLSLLLPARLYHIMDDRLYTIYQSVVLFFFESYTGVEIVIYGDLPDKKENMIYLSNHQCTVDWIIADMLAIRQNALGHVRYVLKDGLKWLPLYGWYFSQHGGIYVKRSAKFNEEAMANKLQQQIKVGTPAYLVIFPEGTRYNPDYPQVIAASQAYARKEGLPELRHAMSPRVRATRVAINTMRGHLDAVYDITVAYEGTVKSSGQRTTAPSMPGPLWALIGAAYWRSPVPERRISHNFRGPSHLHGFGADASPPPLRGGGRQSQKHSTRLESSAAGIGPSHYLMPLGFVFVKSPGN
ncbi:1-acyl-sn-glycerol-3-phosphate acyltransferase epsilon isoform X2 [Heptranchias perlo]|uniref:1-acyl-sn-glycerol-3-phosphate acyltransferase epsilon isoform X2 n=1 Tax=Heptranchias perlo TaxID=212740 RepID=UPI003559E0F3